ncbi:hypothetical protein HDA35_000630 [Micromonospora purpureochromogenes]|uniref:Uncharacterized protein n=1 Tax=Micromonospora purpureochromogenes TaxID=47872 RepID=A0ABX2RE68_9ACTN|nr:hypothetical protein [Micromonospora purpureochromogenes]
MAVRMAVRAAAFGCYLLGVSYRPSAAPQLVRHLADAYSPKDHCSVLAVCHKLEAIGQHGDETDAGDRYEIRPRNSELSEDRGDHDVLRSDAEPGEWPCCPPMELWASPRPNLWIDVGNAAASPEVLRSHAAIIADADKHRPPVRLTAGSRNSQLGNWTRSSHRPAPTLVALVPTGLVFPRWASVYGPWMARVILCSVASAGSSQCRPQGAPYPAPVAKSSRPAPAMVGKLRVWNRHRRRSSCRYPRPRRR